MIIEPTFILPLIAEIEVSYIPKHKPYTGSVNTTADMAAFLKSIYRTSAFQLFESFYCVYINRANRVLGVAEISKGGITGTVADPRLILGIALKAGATSIVLSHNHPSGNLKPSKADEVMTQKIKQAAAFMDIVILDHIILSIEGFFSFAEEGLL
jgi:DNA repair protein RadC